MFIKSVKFKRDENSDWEEGFYIGRCDNDDKNKSTILDNNYQALPRDEKWHQVWDMKYDLDRNIEFKLPIEGEFNEGKQFPPIH